MKHKTSLAAAPFTSTVFCDGNAHAIAITAETNATALGGALTVGSTGLTVTSATLSCHDDGEDAVSSGTFTNATNTYGIGAGIVASIFVVLATTISPPATSGPLSSTMLVDLPIVGVSQTTPTAIAPTFVDLPTSFTGTWNGTAAPDWQGTFAGTGQRIRSVPSTGTGIERIAFAGLTKGYLPKNSFFVLSDVDGGSITTEIIKLTAWDTSGALITAPWLNEPVFLSGTGPFVAAAAPDYIWDGNGTYTFDGRGETFFGNPQIGIYMHNNQNIGTLEVNDMTEFAGFSLLAPTSVAIPVPAAIWLLGSGLIGLIGTRMRKSKVR